VIRAKAILAVANSADYQEAARLAGQKSGDSDSRVVARFNTAGLLVLQPRHRGGPNVKYHAAERKRVLRDAWQVPDPAIDGTNTWSLTTLQKALRKAEDGLLEFSTERIWAILQEAGFRWQKSRSWCETGQVARKRKRGVVQVADPDTAKKELIEQAYNQGENMGLAVWVEDEAWPYQTMPYPGESWQPAGHPVQQPHEYLRNGTGNGQNAHPLSSRQRSGAGARGNEQHERGALSLAQNPNSADYTFGQSPEPDMEPKRWSFGGVWLAVGAMRLEREMRRP
jgi:transposase